MSRRLAIAAESWPVRGAFTIARDSVTAIEVVTVTLEEDGAVGRGECRPYGRYGESVAGVMADLESIRAAIEAGMDRDTLQAAMPPGAARNALDCALWDLEARRTGTPVWRLAGLAPPRPAVTAYTLSLDTPERMAAAAQAAADRPLLKLKLTGEGDLERVQAVRQAVPSARLIVDANEGWSVAHLRDLGPAFARLGVALIEQPLPAGADAALTEAACPVPLCADESCHDRRSLDRLAGLYQLVNIKLDKTGGLTEALLLATEARRRGFGLMVGCMLATSLALAPAMLLAADADFVDLDGPLLLAKDREPGLAYTGSTVHPPPPALWG
ncbi:MAG: L-Ala-D/L-Glu epimerase [Alphaproteobacteria bacterium]|nr:L-Ala-D/L-Glu epimerase [Alphaproteobacteria bacterium]